MKCILGKEMHFVVVGINYKSADVVVREKFHFPADDIQQAYNKLNSYGSIGGSVILSTCNRVEIYASVDDIDNGINDIVSFISQYHNLPLHEITPFIYKKNCHEAVYHLLGVVSSLDSMVIGEYQIQGQVRNAYFEAKEYKATNGLLNKVFQAAIQTGKRVRNETKIGEGSVSVATLAVEIVTKYFSQNDTFSVLLVGAGKMSTLTAQNFQKFFNNCNIRVANRSLENAHKLAEVFNGHVVDFDKRYEAISSSDVVVVSTSSDDFVVKESLLSEILKSSPVKNRLFIDLSIPRNIDPNISRIGNVRTYSIDDINKIIDSNLDRRATEIDKAKCIINEVADEYFDWYLTQLIMPTMLEIKNRMGVLKDRTISSYGSYFQQIDDKQSAVIHQMLDSYSDKLIKIIMLNIRKATTKEELLSITNTLRETLTLEMDSN
jgi:glutamyl-tRNA reductase